MNTNILALASNLSDHDLLARIGVLAGNEREATVELVAHLAVLDARPTLFAAEGHGSLFTYCTEVLRLSEDATCNRIQAARACRDFPVILEKVEKTKLGAAAKPRPGPIRPEADRQLRTPILPSRDVPRHVQRASRSMMAGSAPSSPETD